jgi:hypothetical protein
MQTHGGSHSNLDGYELFRRAIVEHDDEAWAEGAARYRAMLISWAGRCSASATILERGDEIADIAFARAWSALTPERFADIPNIGALLAYMRTCVTSAVIDCARNALLHERLSQALEGEDAISPEDEVIDRLTRQELWQIAIAEARCEQERVVLVEGFVYGLRSATILMRHPTIFDAVAQVYTAKRNLVERLKRNPDLGRLYDEW